MSEQSGTSKLDFLYRECAAGSPLIVVNQDLTPHIKDSNIPVSEVIERLYVHGSIAAVISYYRDVNEAQIKDALAYTARFIELACAASNQNESR